MNVIMFNSNEKVVEDIKKILSLWKVSDSAEI